MTKPKRVLIDDAWFWATENKSTCIFIRYTWRGHVRQWRRLDQVIKHGSKMKPKHRVVLHGDSTWFIETKDKSTLIFVARTWRSHVRRLIGIDGYMGDGEYVFRRGRVRFRGRLHYFLNRWLSAKHPQLNPKKWKPVSEW